MKLWLHTLGIIQPLKEPISLCQYQHCWHTTLLLYTDVPGVSDTYTFVCKFVYKGLGAICLGNRILLWRQLSYVQGKLNYTSSPIPYRKYSARKHSRESKKKKNTNQQTQHCNKKKIIPAPSMLGNPRKQASRVLDPNGLLSIWKAILWKSLGLYVPLHF